MTLELDTRDAPDPAALCIGRPAAAETDLGRYIPTEDVGKIAPNYYCRGWNAKHKKYCSARAGHKTAHPGRGRCKFHGGLQPGDGRARPGSEMPPATAAIRPRRVKARVASSPDATGCAG